MAKSHLPARPGQTARSGLPTSPDTPSTLCGMTVSVAGLARSLRREHSPRHLRAVPEGASRQSAAEQPVTSHRSRLLGLIAARVGLLSGAQAAVVPGTRTDHIRVLGLVGLGLGAVNEHRNIRVRELPCGESGAVRLWWGSHLRASRSFQLGRTIRRDREQCARTFRRIGSGNSSPATTRSRSRVSTPRDYEFATTSRDVSVGLDETVTAFIVGVLLRTSGIASRVTVEGGGLGEVTVTLSGADDRTTTTDASGQRSFGGLWAGDYTVAISCYYDNLYVFEKASIEVTLANAESAIVNVEGRLELRHWPPRMHLPIVGTGCDGWCTHRSEGAGLPACIIDLASRIDSTLQEYGKRIERTEPGKLEKVRPHGGAVAGGDPTTQNLLWRRKPASYNP